MVTINTPYSALPPAQRLRKFQEQILNCKNELEKKQKAKYNISPKKKRNLFIFEIYSREGLTKMKVVFQENPKFGDEQDVTEQIISIDENIEKLLAEIKRFEVRNQSFEWTDCSTNEVCGEKIHIHSCCDHHDTRSMSRPIRSFRRNSY